MARQNNRRYRWLLNFTVVLAVVASALFFISAFNAAGNTPVVVALCELGILSLILGTALFFLAGMLD